MEPLFRDGRCSRSSTGRLDVPGDHVELPAGRAVVRATPELDRCRCTVRLLWATCGVGLSDPVDTSLSVAPITAGSAVTGSDGAAVADERIKAYSSASGSAKTSPSATTGSTMRTLCYAAYVSVNVSVRLDDALAERLRLRARTAGETLSDRLRRYAEEGARRDEHPLVTFRDGPAGRRAGLLGGPDVWEAVMWLEDLAAEADPIAALVEDSILTRSQVDAALRYRAAYPDEIAARIELHRRETAAAETP
jgi:hypothetical protein